MVCGSTGADCGGAAQRGGGGGAARSTGGDWGAAGFWAGIPAAAGAPQREQKRTPGRSGAPHWVQAAAGGGALAGSADPQAVQNRIPSGVSLPQVGQRIPVTSIPLRGGPERNLTIIIRERPKCRFHNPGLQILPQGPMMGGKEAY